jgi:hypothetical protein
MPLPVSILSQSSPAPCVLVPLFVGQFHYYPSIYSCVLQVVSFTSGLPIQTVYASLVYPIRAACTAHLFIHTFIQTMVPALVPRA